MCHLEMILICCLERGTEYVPDDIWNYYSILGEDIYNWLQCGCWDAGQPWLEIQEWIRQYFISTSTFLKLLSSHS